MTGASPGNHRGRFGGFALNFVCGGLPAILQASVVDVFGLCAQKHARDFGRGDRYGPVEGVTQLSAINVFPRFGTCLPSQIQILPTREFLKTAERIAPSGPLTSYMAYPIDQRLVIAVASSALFDLTECDRIYREHDLEAYRAHQRERENEVLPTGVAFPLIRRILGLNRPENPYQPIEVILLSRNDPDTGLRVFKSIEQYQLNITRAAFVSGRDPFRYLAAFNTSLFLSANANDVSQALSKNVAAGQVFPTQFSDDGEDNELRIAFDFDGVIADDSAEAVFKQQKLPGFFKSEVENAAIPLPVGPLHRFFTEIAKIQQMERERDGQESPATVRIRTAIVTARNAPAHERVVTSLRSWGIQVDEAFFLGGIEKARVLQTFKPHIFFDDQLVHIEGAACAVPCAHVPFGIANRRCSEHANPARVMKKQPDRAEPNGTDHEAISA